MSSDDALRNFASSADNGLSSQEADARLEKFGKNRLLQKKKITIIHRLLEQFGELMVIILIIAGVIAFALGERIDALIIFFIVIINAVIGVLQEYKAERAVDALKKMINPQATVLRDGEEKIVSAETLVPGDILILEEGSRIPADARIIECSMLQVDEAVLTGESRSRSKDSVCLEKKEISVADMTNMLFMGTVITRGRCKAIVVETGMKTEFGRIAGLTSDIKDEKSPLQKEIERVGKFIAKAVLVICVIVFLLGIFKGKGLFEMFFFAVSLGVAAVPEGLPATMTIALAIGVQRMARKKAIVRKLSSVETLGSTTVICTDKTGTLTKNEMTVRKVFVNNKIIDVSGEGYNPEGHFTYNNHPYDDPELQKLLINGALCNNSCLKKENYWWSVIGDTTEGALVVSAEKAGLSLKKEKEEYERIYEIPFSSDRKMMITIHERKNKGKKEHYAFMKGAVKEILDKCSYQEVDGKIKKLTTREKDKIKQTNRDMSNQALRVLGFAYKKLKGAEAKNYKKLREESFIFQGLQAMIDPPRPEVRDAVAKCRLAGMKIFIVTGDHGLTARAIAKEIGLATDLTRIITGIELDKMNEEELSIVLNEEVIFARVTAENKMRIVSTLMKKGEIVAVTGDGVNDAPAIKKANIGVAMGITGTDVSKEASKMILVDDSFATIVNAIEEGRTIFENIRTFLKYLFIGNGAGILAIVLTLILGLPLPLLALQILWFNLLTETIPSLALTKEPPAEGIMNQKARKLSEIFITKKDITEIVLNSLVITLGVLGVFYYALSINGWQFGIDMGLKTNPAYQYATTLAFTTLVLFQLFNVFNVKSPNTTIFFKEIFNNKWLLAATVFSIMIQIAVVHLPVLNAAFYTTPLGIIDWAMAAGVATSIIAVNEVYKLFHNRKLHKKMHMPDPQTNNKIF